MTSAAASPASYGAEEPSALRQGLLLATLTFVTMLYAMTVTIANVSLPQMQGSLSSTPDQIAWIVTFNIVATAIVTPIAGWLAAVFGRRRLMIGAVIGFGVSSVLCGLASSVPELVVYRIGQGAFGAPLVPLSQAIVLETFPPNQRARVMAIFSTGVIFGPIVAPVIGGALSEAYSWRWVFFMLVPFTAIALIGVLIFIKDNARGVNPRLDWTGFLALAALVTALQLMLDRGERAGWFSSWEILIYAGCCAAALYVFIVRNLTSPRPFLNPGLLRDRNFVVGAILIFLFGMLNFTPITLLPTLLQTVQGYPDSIIGQILAARGAGTLISFAAMFFAGRLDPRIPLIIGFALQAWSGWIMAGFTTDVSVEAVLWASALQGVGVGFVWVPLSVVTFATLPPALGPDGTAIFHLVRNVGSSVFISLSVALVIRESRISYAELAPNLSPFSERLRLYEAAGGFDLDGLEGLAAISREMGRQATMIGYIDAFVLFAVVSAIGVPLIALVRASKTP